MLSFTGTSMHCVNGLQSHSRWKGQSGGSVEACTKVVPSCPSGNATLMLPNKELLFQSRGGSSIVEGGYVPESGAWEQIAPPYWSSSSEFIVGTHATILCVSIDC